MKTISINQKKAMNMRTFILVLVLLPLINYAGMPQNSNLTSYLKDQYAISEKENQEDRISDVNSLLNEVSENIQTEEKIAIEKWMVNVNDKSWHNEVVEEEIQIEEWMYNVESFSSRLIPNEEEIEIENWMLDPSSWIEYK